MQNICICRIVFELCMREKKKERKKESKKKKKNKVEIFKFDFLHLVKH